MWATPVASASWSGGSTWAELEEALRRSALGTGIRATGGGHLWSRAHIAASSRESRLGWPEMVVSRQRSQQVSTAPEGRPRWEKGAKVLWRFTA